MWKKEFAGRLYEAVEKMAEIAHPDLTLVSFTDQPQTMKMGFELKQAPDALAQVLVGQETALRPALWFFDCLPGMIRDADVRRLSDAMAELRSREGMHIDCYGILALVVEPSDAIKRRCVEKGVGYIVPDGSILVSVRGLRFQLVKEEGRVLLPYETLEDVVRSKKGQKVLKELKNRYRKSHTVASLSRACGVSSTTIYRVRDLFLNRGLLEFAGGPGKHFQLTEEGVQELRQLRFPEDKDPRGPFKPFKSMKDIASSPKGSAVLDYMAKNYSKEMTVTAIARGCGVSTTTVYRVRDRMIQDGLMRYAASGGKNFSLTEKGLKAVGVEQVQARPESSKEKGQEQEQFTYHTKHIEPRKEARHDDQ